MATFANFADTLIPDLANPTTVNLPSGTASGDLLIAYFCCDELNQTVSATGWTFIGQAFVSSPDGQNINVLGRISNGSDPNTFQSGGGTVQAYGRVLRWTGSALSVPTSSDIVFTTNNSSNASPISISLTGITAIANDSILVGFGIDQQGRTDEWTCSQITNYTNNGSASDNNWQSINTQYRDGVSAGATGSLATTATRTIGGSNAGWLGFVMRIASGASAVDLITSNATSSQSAENVNLSSDTFLSINNSAHNQTADNISLSNNTSLTIGNKSHGQSSDNITLTNDYTLTLNNSIHSVSSDSMALSTETGLTINDSTHNHIAESIAFTLNDQLSISDTIHNNLTDNVTLSITGQTNLNINDAIHSQTVDLITLTSNTGIIVNNSNHAHYADNVVLELNVNFELYTNNASHSLTSDNLSFTTNQLIAINSSINAHSANNIDLSTLHGWM